MRKLSSFIMTTLNGYYADANSDMSWAHRNDPEINEFTSKNASGGGSLLFGRTTYEMMAAWWPSEAAKQAMPEVAAGMNRMPKYVLSHSLKKADWAGTEIIRSIDDVKKLKAGSGPDIAIMGSGQVVGEVAEAGLLDKLQVLMNPLAFGGGKLLFSDVKKKLNLTLTNTRQFKNGCVLLEYVPA
jgi:dihydrofolate reductase